MLFVGDRFPVPVDCGAKIRTTQILRGLRGGTFNVHLACPAPSVVSAGQRRDLAELAARTSHWRARRRGAIFQVARLRHLLAPVPVPVASDFVKAGRDHIARQLKEKLDVVVVDFPHTCIMMPERLPVPSVLFTHNVEAEIFRRHADVSRNPVRRAIWRDQFRKMEGFERQVLNRFDAVVAVSERDKRHFEDKYEVRNVQVIPTGVDLEYFSYAPPGDQSSIVFLGSMDWLPNDDAVRFFADEVWSRISARMPGALMRVVGRSPPEDLVASTARFGSQWHFTGFVDDVRRFVQDSGVMVIPLRIGGGTRLKVYEAMAMGCPIVSTRIGVEGLPVTAGEHYLQAESADEMADAVQRLLEDRVLARKISTSARRLAEEQGAFRIAAKKFEQICESVLR